MKRFISILVLSSSFFVLQGCCSLKLLSIENQFPMVGDLTCAGKNTAISLDRFIVRLKIPLPGGRDELENLLRNTLGQEVTLEDCKCGDPNLWMVILSEAMENKGDLLGVVSGLEQGNMTTDPLLVYNLEKSNEINIPESNQTGPPYPPVNNFFSSNPGAIVLAILDSGVNLKLFTGEKFLFQNPAGIVCTDDGEPSSGYNFIDKNTDIQDYAVRSHGTFVTKKITESLQDQLGTKYQILPLKISNDSQVSYWDLLCAVSFIKQLKVEHDIDVKIINASLGFKLNKNKIPLLDDLELPSQMSLLQGYIDELSESALFVTAAGNEHKDVDKKGKFLYYPVGFNSETLVGVGGLSENGLSKHLKSNYGRESVDIAAPYVHSVINEDVKGTSIGAAQISASLAQLLFQNPSSNPRKLKKLFFDNANRSPSLEEVIKCGYYEQ